MLATLHEQSMRIIGRNSQECSAVSPERANVKRVCVLFHKIITDNICLALQSHFKNHKHNNATRNNNNSVSLPKISTDMLVKDFFTWGLGYITICRQVSELPKMKRNVWKHWISF